LVQLFDVKSDAVDRSKILQEPKNKQNS